MKHLDITLKVDVLAYGELTPEEQHLTAMARAATERS